MSLRTVKFKGEPLEISGDLPNVGDKAQDFSVVDNKVAKIKLSDKLGKVLILSSVPSLDTPVCDLQTRRFNQEVVELGPEVEVLTISMDLPFAQKRWCAAAGVDRVTTLSDHSEASFGKAFGVLLPKLRLLSRAVFVLDKEGIVRYRQIVEDIGNEPDYEPVLEAVKKLV